MSVEMARSSLVHINLSNNTDRLAHKRFSSPFQTFSRTSKAELQNVPDCLKTSKQRVVYWCQSRKCQGQTCDVSDVTSSDVAACFCDFAMAALSWSSAPPPANIGTAPGGNWRQHTNHYSCYATKNKFYSWYSICKSEWAEQVDFIHHCKSLSTLKHHIKKKNF